MYTEFFSGGGNFTTLLSISKVRRCYIIKKKYFLGKLKGWEGGGGGGGGDPGTPPSVYIIPGVCV